MTERQYMSMKTFIYIYLVIYTSINIYYVGSCIKTLITLFHNHMHSSMQQHNTFMYMHKLPKHKVTNNKVILHDHLQ